MRIADTAAFTDWNDDLVECARCGRENVVKLWSDVRTLRWGFEAFDCIYCGETTPGEEYDVAAPGEHGSTSVMLQLFTLGFLLVVGSLAATFWTPWPFVVTIAGAALMAAMFTIAALTWLNHQENR